MQYHEVVERFFEEFSVYGECECEYAGKFPNVGFSITVTFEDGSVKAAGYMMTKQEILKLAIPKYVVDDLVHRFHKYFRGTADAIS